MEISYIHICIDIFMRGLLVPDGLQKQAASLCYQIASARLSAEGHHAMQLPFLSCLNREKVLVFVFLVLKISTSIARSL